MDTDFLLLNARIWTGNPLQPWADALAAANGRITAVGATAELKQLAQQHTTVIDAQGRLTLPGFIDNHTHFITGGFHLLNGNLRDTHSTQETDSRGAIKPSEDGSAAALSAAMKHAASLGITSIQDISSWDDWAVYRRFWENGWLTLRIYARTPIPAWEQQVDMRLEHGSGDEWLKLGGVKGLVDGALSSGTALMHEPFDDEPGNSGLLFEQMFPEGIMKQRATMAAQAGLPVSIHAIGDRANTILLNMYEEMLSASVSSPRALRIEHAQHLLPADIARIGLWGFTVSMQPVHLLDDGSLAQRRIGAKRAQTTFACRSLLDAGAKVTFGTDWPLAPLNPLLGIYAAVTRTPAGGKGPWIPEQAITVEEAVRAYTVQNAYAEFADHVKGTLEPGKLADLIVLSQDIFLVEAEAIPHTKVLYTVLNGKILYTDSL